MILADTSILIEYIKNPNSARSKKMSYVIDNNMPYGICSFVYQELLQGAANRREYGLLKDYFGSLPFYELKYGKESFENAALIYMDCRKNGITIRSTIDLIIAEIAIENNLFLLHNDNDFMGISRVCKTLKIF